MVESRRWYAVQTQPNGEKATADQLDRLGFEAYSPLAEVDVVRRGKVLRLSIPAFPTYLLCAMPPTAEAWRAASDAKGVNRLLGKDDEGTPMQLRPGEVEAIRQRELRHELQPPRTKPLSKNCSVRVKFGHFTNFIGTFLWRNGQRARIRLGLLGGETDVDIPLMAIERADSVTGQLEEKSHNRPRRKRHPAKIGVSDLSRMTS